MLPAISTSAGLTARPRSAGRKLKDRNRDPEKERARNRAYQQAHREELREKARLRRLAHPGQAAADSAYARRKRKLIAEEAQANAG